MKKICRSVSIMLVMAMVLVGCGSTDTPDTERNTQQMETESNATDQDEEISSATSETTEITTEVITETESEIITEVETETQTESEVPSEPEAPIYTYTDLNKTMYAKSSVNVRDLPSTDGSKLGGLSKAQEVHVTGQCNETNWYRIEYNGSVGYVSSNYLVDEKPVEETPIQPSEPEECPVPLHQIVDCGETFYMWRNSHHWEDVGQRVAWDEAQAYANQKFGGTYVMNGCEDHIEWNGYTLCKEVYYASVEAYEEAKANGAN